MAYEFIATTIEGDELCSYETQNYDAAHALLGALDIPFEATDEIGNGDEYEFTDSELSAAEAALAGLVMPRIGETEGLVFLADLRLIMQTHGTKACHILIC